MICVLKMLLTEFDATSLDTETTVCKICQNENGTDGYLMDTLLLLLLFLKIHIVMTCFSSMSPIILLIASNIMLICT